MSSSSSTRCASGGLRVAATCVVWLTWTLVSSGQVTSYVPKNGILNWKAVLLGGGFRVTTAIPLHGDFSKYSRLEISRTESLIGPDVPAKVLEQLTLGLVTEFRKGGRFSEIAIVDTFAGLRSSTSTVDRSILGSYRDADPLDAPMRTWDDLLAFDRERQADANSPPVSDETLEVQCQVIDYAKGNKFLQLLFLDLGNAVLTLRFSYFDKQSGEELGRSVISSDNSSKAIPSVLSTRSALTGVIEGLVDQVTRRKIAGER
jgi:hypothetical protein